MARVFMLVLITCTDVYTNANVMIIIKEK